jgi:hypothetical protein
MERGNSLHLKKRNKDLKDERKKHGGTEDPHQAQGL